MNFKDKFIILDGAMGTMLQNAGLKPGENPEIFNLEHPEIIECIHRQYVEAGSEIIYTNTFGANAKKLSATPYTVEEVIHAGVQAARRAANNRARVALDIGPIGEMLVPNGTLPFEEAYELFREQAVIGEAAGADLAVIETMTDLLEVKAAILAIRENTNLPVIATMTFEQNGFTFAGCRASAMARTLSGLGVSALGVNCSLGPRELLPIVHEISQNTHLPIIVKANAGLPDFNGDYEITPDEFAELLEDYLKEGVTIFGGCCGTTPDYIRAIGRMMKGHSPSQRNFTPQSVLCSMSRVVSLDHVAIIGERINPTGKKLLKQALTERNFDYILTQGIEQADAGAEILDVNVGMPGIDECELMTTIVTRLQAVLDTPLQIDTTNSKVLEAALRIYRGKPLINSVNGDEKSLNTVLPLAKKYGAAVLGLCLDENGIPPSAEDRFNIAERILKAALCYGIPREDVYIDCLTLTASVQQAEVRDTLRAVKMVKEKLGLKTVLGVSNISFGLPNRSLINHTFLTLALAHGLDLPIINPNASEMIQAIDTFNLLYNHDVGAKNFVLKHSNIIQAPQAANNSIDEAEAIEKGLPAAAARAAENALKTMSPLDIINDKLIPALDRVGEKFERGEIFLPQLMQSANAAQQVFDVIKKVLSATETPTVSNGKIALATVYGDIHDIGKNIVKVILENYGYTIFDLGKNVPVDTVVETVIKNDIKLVGLSALMTTTLASMEETIKALRKSVPDCIIFVGGAVLTAEYAKKIGADYYARDAKQSADIAKRILS